MRRCFEPFEFPPFPDCKATVPTCAASQKSNAWIICHVLALRQAFGLIFQAETIASTRSGLVFSRITSSNCCSLITKLAPSNVLAMDCRLEVTFMELIYGAALLSSNFSLSLLKHLHDYLFHLRIQCYWRFYWLLLHICVLEDEWKWNIFGSVCFYFRVYWARSGSY